MAASSAVAAPFGLTTLYQFTGGADGAVAPRGVVFDAQGNAYGTSQLGADNCSQALIYPGLGCGTIWRLAPDGAFTTIHTFVGTDGAQSDGNLVLHAGQIYGTTTSGGPGGFGTAFKVARDGSNFQLLHSFSGADGSNPEAGVVVNSNGDVFGTTEQGGAGFSGVWNSGDGTLWEIPAGGSFQVLKAFSGPDGANPSRIYFGPGGVIFGGTFAGGTGTNSICPILNLPGPGCGVAFSYNPANGQYAILHDFQGSDGSGPIIGQVGSGGVVTASTQLGGSNNLGTLFRLRPNGSGGYAFEHVYDFRGASDGSYPIRPRALPFGAMLGVSENGGTTATGPGKGVLWIYWNGAVYPLVTFDGSNGAYPLGQVTFGPGFQIYETTLNGGIAPCLAQGGATIAQAGCGTIFAFNPFGTMAETAVRALMAAQKETVFDR